MPLGASQVVERHEGCAVNFVPEKHREQWGESMVGSGPLTPALSPAVTRVRGAESLAGERGQEVRDR